jgi:hypothetical protein
LGRDDESGDFLVLGLKESSSCRVVGLSLFVPCEEVMVVLSSEFESLVSPGLASLFVPCEEARWILGLDTSTWGTVLSGDLSVARYCICS